MIDEIDEALADIPGIVTAVEQPLAHLISHMLSGVKAQVAIKLYGDDLDVLRREAEKMQAAIAGIDGVRDLQVEQQVIIPQLRIEADGHKLEQFGLRRLDVNEFVETAMQGEVVSEVLDGQRTFDLVVRLDERYREDLDALKRLVIETPVGGTVKLEDVARIYKAGGPNTINREQVRRRIVVQCNVRDRGLVDVVNDIKERLAPIEAAAAHRVLHRVRRAVREPAVGVADDRRAVRGVAGRHLSGAVHDVSLGEPVAAGDGGAADGVHRRGGGAGDHRADAHGRGDGRLHRPGGRRVAQRHSAAESLPAPGASTKARAGRRR